MWKIKSCMMLEKKMIQSKKDNELRKKADGDSDLIFNSQNSDI